MIHNGSFSGGAKHGLYRNEQPPPTEQKSIVKGKGAVVANAVLALAGGGIFYYFKVLKPKQKSKQPQDAELSEIEYDEYDEDEEYTEALEEIADEMSNDDSETDA